LSRENTLHIDPHEFKDSEFLIFVLFNSASVLVCRAVNQAGRQPSPANPPLVPWPRCSRASLLPLPPPPRTPHRNPTQCRRKSASASDGCRTHSHAPAIPTLTQNTPNRSRNYTPSLYAIISFPPSLFCHLLSTVPMGDCAVI